MPSRPAISLPDHTVSPTTRAGARVALHVERPERRLLGENVLVDYCLENAGTAPLTIQFGGDYRGSSRHVRFHVTATDASGITAPDPDPNPYNLGGLSVENRLEPGKSYCDSLPLSRYVRVEHAGTYLIRIDHDAGMPNGSAPSGEIRIAFEMPSAGQAEEVVRAMEALPVQESVSAGKLTGPRPDFFALRYPVYLAPLERRAQAGDIRAFEGLGSIPSVDASRALLKLMDHPKPEIARAAAESLAMRLPDPALSGKLGPRNPFFNELGEQRKYLVRTSWDPSLAELVRAKAKVLLASNEDHHLISGAFFLEAVGKVEDNALLLAALDRAIAKTANTPREARMAPTPRGACQELRRASTVLIDRGLAPLNPPRSLGEIAQWIELFRTGARPARWEATLHGILAHSNAYVRRMGLEVLPEPVPAAFVADVGDALGVADPDVQEHAASLLRRDDLTSLAPRLAVVIANTKDRHTLRTVWEHAVELGARAPAAQAMAGRIAEPEIGDYALQELVRMFDAPVRLTEIDPKEAPALQQRWTSWVAGHRVGLAGKKAIPGPPKELLPKDSTFER